MKHELIVMLMSFSLAALGGNTMDWRHGRPGVQIATAEHVASTNGHVTTFVQNPSNAYEIVDGAMNVWKLTPVTNLWITFTDIQTHDGGLPPQATYLFPFSDGDWGTFVGVEGVNDWALNYKADFGIWGAPAGTAFPIRLAPETGDIDGYATISQKVSVVTSRVDRVARLTDVNSATNGHVLTTDPRLSDARTPIGHTQDWETITGEPQFVSDTDPRLSDARTPVAHNQAWSTITDAPAAPTRVPYWTSEDGKSFATMEYGTGIVWEVVQPQWSVTVAEFNENGVYHPAGTFVVPNLRGVVLPTGTFPFGSDGGYVNSGATSVYVQNLNLSGWVNYYETMTPAGADQYADWQSESGGAFPVLLFKDVAAAVTNRVATRALANQGQIDELGALVEEVMGVADGAVGAVNDHIGDTAIHVGAGEKAIWNAKVGSPDIVGIKVFATQQAFDEWTPKLATWFYLVK